MIGLGLSRLNCQKLLEGKPIFIDLKVMMFDAAERHDLNEATVLLFAGETEAAMQAELSKFLGPLPARKPHYDEN